MDSLVSMYANATGLWKKIAAWLPLIGGLGSLLSGLGGVALEFSHSTNAGGALKVLQGLQSDPNMALITAGLVALGINSNHKATAAQVADHADTLATLAPAPAPAPTAAPTAPPSQPPEPKP